MKALIVLLAALALFGCATPDLGTHDLALNGASKPGAREALQRQLDLPNCHRSARSEATRLADGTAFYETVVAFTVVGETAQSAQLDDPTRDWTRDQTVAPTGHCPPTGRKHRYFA